MLKVAALAARHKKWLLCVGIALAAMALTFWPQGLSTFRYDRLALAQGEWWRLVSAHVVHVNSRHVLLNVAGLWLISELLWDELSLRHGLGLLATSALGINALLWWGHPELGWYAGLSGALHGLWAGCALTLCREAFDKTIMPTPPKKDRSMSAWIGVAGFLLLLLKLFAETLIDSPASMSQAIGAPVIIIAHLYGALMGIVYVVIWQGWRRWHRKA